MTRSGLLLDTAFTRADLSAQRREDFVLATHELLANAIVHGGGGGHVQVFRAGGELRCLVRDRGPGISADAVDGCGLRVVRACTDRLEICATGAGTAVTITITITAPGNAHGEVQAGRSGPAWTP
jgi:serine/threonine-protein kinase RsbW